jgi:hypothetical protein
MPLFYLYPRNKDSQLNDADMENYVVRVANVWISGFETSWLLLWPMLLRYLSLEPIYGFGVSSKPAKFALQSLLFVFRGPEPQFRDPFDEFLLHFELFGKEEEISGNVFLFIRLLILLFTVRESTKQPRAF